MDNICPDCNEPRAADDTGPCPWKVLIYNPKNYGRNGRLPQWVWDRIDERGNSQALIEVYFHDYIRAVLKGSELEGYLDGTPDG